MGVQTPRTAARHLGIVIPINSTTRPAHQDTFLYRRRDDSVHFKILGYAGTEYEEAMLEEIEELNRERVRLWYVALTRARDLLLLPRQSERVNRDWMSLIDIDVESLPVFDTGRFGGMPTLPEEPARNRQDATTWLREEEAIAAGEEEAKEATDPEAGGSPVHPALKRGLILHKLMEEVLTGETRDDAAHLQARAAELIEQQELEDSPDASSWISSPAMAEMVIRTVRRPEIAALRPRLVPEYWVYGSDADGQEMSITAGIADAVAFDDDGRIDVVVDWKSDVNLRERQIRMYREQVRLYLKATGARIGLIVFLGSGHIETVTPGD